MYIEPSNSDWIEGATAPAMAMTVSQPSVSANYVDGAWYPVTSRISYWPYIVETHRPITLKLSEVERLRAAARKDKALKAILQKFTPQIAIEVDFD